MNPECYDDEMVVVWTMDRNFPIKYCPYCGEKLI